MTDEERAEMQEMISLAATGIEDRLITTFGKIIENISAKVDLSAEAFSELEGKAGKAFESLPVVIKTQVENQLKVLTKQFEERQAGAGNGGDKVGGGGFGLKDLLGHADKIVEVINAWKQPTTEAAMMGQMNLIFRWHGLLSKLEKGGGTGDDITKAIADTFGPEKKE